METVPPNELFHVMVDYCSCALIAFALAYQFIKRRRECRDNTELEQPDQFILEHAKTQEALLREVNHRVKNNFTSLVGLLQMKREYAHTTDEASHLKDMETKLTSLASVHGMLSLNRWRPIRLEELCQSLIRTATTLSGTPCRLKVISLPSDLHVNRTQVHPITLIMNELTANAIKHAVRPGTPLVITITLQEAEHSTHLSFEDNGPGYSPSIMTNPERTCGQGLHIIRDLATSSLRGTYSFSNNPGAMACVLFPKLSPHHPCPV